jgi:S-adenosylmethionine synthetase
VDRDRDLVFQNELKQGSLELTGLFERQEAGANDTSAAVGYAPLSETEKLVLAAEKYLNSLECTKDFPEAGEDVKVMAYRLDGHVFLTVAVAFADRFIPDVATYFERKEALQKALYSHLSAKLRTVQELTIEVNTLDDATRGEEGMYLTVLGTSAEGADCGQVGRGNRVNGLITLRRPMSTEAAAGKNPTNHVGKIYSVLTHKTAMEVYSGVPEVAEVFIWLGSQIGRSIADPAHISAHLVLHPGAALKDVSQKVQEIIDRELSDVHTLTMRLARGEIPVW